MSMVNEAQAVNAAWDGGGVRPRLRSIYELKGDGMHESSVPARRLGELGAPYGEMVVPLSDEASARLFDGYPLPLRSPDEMRRGGLEYMQQAQFMGGISWEQERIGDLEDSVRTLTEERDAAIRERDAARFQADKYWEDARYWRHEARRRHWLQRLRAWLART